MPQLVRENEFLRVENKILRRRVKDKLASPRFVRGEGDRMDRTRVPLQHTETRDSTGRCLENALDMPRALVV